MWPSCQLPYISLPIAQKRTPYGSAWPFSARSLPIGVVAARVGILDFLDGRLHVAQAAVDGDVRIGAQLAAEGHEFVDAEIVVFDALPGGIFPRRPAIGIAQAVAPVVSADEIAARPAIDRRVQLLEQRQRVGPACRGRCRPASSTRCQRVSVPSPRALISSRPRRVVLPAVKSSGVFANSALTFGNRDCLPIARRVAPDEADLDRDRLCFAASQMRPDVGLALRQRQVRLHNAARLRRRERDLRAMFAHEGCFVDPSTRRRAAPTAFQGDSPLADRIEELAIFEHFGPDAAVDADGRGAR